MTGKEILEAIKSHYLPCEDFNHNDNCRHAHCKKSQHKRCESLMAVAERVLFMAAMEACYYNQAEAAKILNISKRKAGALRFKYLPNLEYIGKPARQTNNLAKDLPEEDSTYDGDPFGYRNHIDDNSVHGGSGASNDPGSVLCSPRPSNQPNPKSDSGSQLPDLECLPRKSIDWKWWIDQCKKGHVDQILLIRTANKYNINLRDYE